MAKKSTRKTHVLDYKAHRIAHRHPTWRCVVIDCLMLRMRTARTRHHHTTFPRSAPAAVAPIQRSFAMPVTMVKGYL